ncbi:tRNA-intron lyase [Ignicoccus hospitalis]|uniref:tRNA intron endonuclease n=1 Tax=Ignicoccus hospitalis (strain KIN4/I / DSM 18386 / JCM 14125) TaxID=453591 RepID=A8A8Q2_IGNH4|nr:tRNA-intron lyase [Ignicoccus hospitalis]ABU81304.1 tRNA intron endonuclease [Ignicoccus hospitalis KIN4/I]HIH90392.1 tRNA-intron lyase [Desulfurococcaceae archaeon]
MYTAYLVGDRVVVLDDAAAKDIYSKGFFGHPLGTEKPKGPEDVKAPLALSPLEALYLLETGVIEIRDITTDKSYSPEELKEIWKFMEGLEEKYLVYKELRNKGFVVRSGLKYGSDFVVYEFGPGIDHAPYVVDVLEKGTSLDPSEIVKGGRVAHGVRKRYIMAIVENGSINYVMLKWYLP